MKESKVSGKRSCSLSCRRCFRLWGRRFSLDKRAERIVKEYGERDQTQEQRLKEKDKRRAAYHRFYTDMKWGHAQNYHICLDSGELGIEKCVELILQLY
ncbi:MAG: cytidylate kinase family protein [Blautia sp.]|nr:cytidylate kinase family protein [Blautia sp.]